MLIRPSCRATRAGQLMGLLLIPLICGCAANTSTESLTIAEGTEPDCSFRSPTTCWTVSGRFPPPRPTSAEPPTPQPPKAGSIKLASPTLDRIEVPQTDCGSEAKMPDQNCDYGPVTAAGVGNNAKRASD
jgi:hypothetical protein